MKVPSKPMRIAMIGNLANVAFSWASQLNSAGISVDLFLSEGEFAKLREQLTSSEVLPSWIMVYPGGLPDYSPQPLRLIHAVARQFELIKLVKRLESYDLVHSFTGALFASIYAIWRFGVRRIKPYVAAATGSDVREKAVDGSLSGQRIAYFFRRSTRTLLLNFDLIEIAEKLFWPNWQFFPFLIDTEFFSPGIVERELVDSSVLLFFMPSRLDWGLMDSGAMRSSTKGNDRFLQALSRYVSHGKKAHLIVLNRGADRQPALDLINRLGLRGHVTIRPAMSRAELVRYFRLADVVVDQFDVGAVGVTAPEAMSCGKPVMVYAKQELAERCYGEQIPVLNAHSEDEILEQIEIAANAGRRSELGREARAWILRHHEARELVKELVEIYERALEENRNSK